MPQSRSQKSLRALCIGAVQNSGVGSAGLLYFKKPSVVSKFMRK